MNGKNAEQHENQTLIERSNNGPVPERHDESGAKYGHAVVIGSGIAGLTAAQVLTRYFDRVSVVDRDQLNARPEFRRGAPQARHAHTLMPRGQMILEQLFPGLTEELEAMGAVAMRSHEQAVFTDDRQRGRQSSSSRKRKMSVNCSRPLLETAIFRRVVANPRVRILCGYEVRGLHVDTQGQRVTGVDLRARGGVEDAITELTADLVVDASGRHSRAPEWLRQAGYRPPVEWRINAFVGYATRVYRRPADFDAEWKALYIMPTPPGGTRGGLIVPLEGGRWHVTLMGVAEDYPPTDEEGFLAFARSLPTPQLYEAIKDAQPLTKPSGFRRAANRVRRYDRLPRYLEGFLVVGDAAYVLNPIYAQGMTAAVIGIQTLDKCLQRQQQRPDLTGLAETFQTQLSQALARLWRMATQHDWHWPTTEVDDNAELLVSQQP